MVSPVKPASAQSVDAGFTLIEVIVAIVLIGASLLTVIGAASAAFAYQAAARQQQVATTIATKKMEEVRALAFNVISAGMPASVFVGDPNVVGSSLTSCGGKNLTSPELIPTTTNPTSTLGTALSGSNLSFVASPGSYRVPPSSGITVNKVKYGWATYITKPSASDAYRATVCVTWTDLQRVQQRTMVQSWIWSPQGPGCVGRPSVDVSGPCATVSATVPDGAVTIEVTHNGTTQSLSFALAGAAAEVSLGERSVATASYTAAAVDLASSVRPVDARTVVTADDDAVTPISSSADTGDVAVLAIPMTTPIIYNPTTNAYDAVTPLQVEYRSGTGHASTSATSTATCSTGTATPALSFPAAWNSVCAAAGLTRGTGFWFDTTYNIGDSYIIHPLAFTASANFSSGAYANLASDGIPTAMARRRFTAMRLGLIEATLPDGTLRATNAAAQMVFADNISLASGAPAPSSDLTTGSNSSAGTDCQLIPAVTATTITGAGGPFSCSFPGASSAAWTPTASRPTERIVYTWAWTFSPSARDDTGVDSSPRTIRSSSPILELTMTIDRTYCSAFRSNGACRTTAVDTHAVKITLSLGTSTVTYDRVG